MSWGVTFFHHGPRSIRCSSPLLGLELVGSIYGVTWEGVTCRRTQEGRGTLLACVRAPGMFPAWLLLSLVVTSNRSLPLSAFQLSHLYSGGRVAQNSETLS